MELPCDSSHFCVLLQLQNVRASRFQELTRNQSPQALLVCFVSPTKYYKQHKNRANLTRRQRPATPVSFASGPLASLLPLSSHREEVMQESLITPKGWKITNGIGARWGTVVFGRIPCTKNASRSWGATSMTWGKLCPNCVIKDVRGRWPNPPHVPYQGHRRAWALGTCHNKSNSWRHFNWQVNTHRNIRLSNNCTATLIYFSTCATDVVSLVSPWIYNNNNNNNNNIVIKDHKTKTCNFIDMAVSKH